MKGVVSAVVLAGVVLSGCANGVDDGSSMARAPAQVRVLSKSFTVAGPRGFCVDTGATRETEDNAFVVLGSCAVISGNPRDSKPKVPAVLTASISPAAVPLDAAALDRMAAFFSSDTGRATLARTEGASAVSVIELKREGGMLLVHAEDGDTSGDVMGDYWRGVFDQSGRLATITVSGFRETPIDDKTGARLARDFVAALRKANAPRGEASKDDGETAGPLSVAGERLASFFNRLP